MMTAERWLTYVINLDRSVERLHQISLELKREAILFERVPAVDGRSLSADAQHEIDAGNFERGLTSGEVGCALSHVAALRRFLETDRKFVLILEDDTILEKDFKHHLTRFIQWTETNNVDFHAANIGYRCRPPFTPLLKSGLHTFGRAHYYPMTAAAVLWTRNGASKFINDNAKIVAPIDIQYRHWIGSSGAGFGVRPPLASQAQGNSEIEAQDQKRSRNDRAERYLIKNYRRKLTERWACIRSWVRQQPTVTTIEVVE